MLAYCGRPAAAASCDPFPYIVPRYARETIAGICSLRVALATATMSQSASYREASRPSLDIPSPQLLHPEFIPYGALSMMAMTWWILLRSMRNAIAVSQVHGCFGPVLGA